MEPEIRTRVEGGRRLFDLFIAGESASHLVVHDLRMWVQGARVRAGGVGGVQTKPEHRRHGYAGLLMNAAVRSMTAEGFALSFLFGIPDFYDAFGYAPFAGTCTVTLRVAEAARFIGSRSGAGYQARALQDNDVPFVVDVHNGSARQRGASVARDAATFGGFTWGTYKRGTATAVILEAHDGERAGYLATRDDQPGIHVVEAAAPRHDGYPCILDELSRMAARKGVEEITFELPADDAFIRSLLPAGCRIEWTYPRNAGAMARVIDQGKLLAAVRAAMERRLAGSRLAPARALVRVETDLGTTSLRVGGGGGRRARAAIRLPQSRLVQLLTGFRSAGELVGSGEASADAHAVRLLEIALRAPQPFVWRVDRF